MHPSHFDEAGKLISERQVCRNCHEPEMPS